MLKGVLLGLAAFVLFSATGAVAADTFNGIATTGDGKTTVIAPTGDHNLSNWHALVPPGTTVIFSNLDVKYPDGTYFCCLSDTVSGPTSQLSSTHWVAGGFQPRANASVSEIALGLGLVSGTNEIIVTLNADNNGVPGKVLASMKATSLKALGGCCTLATVKPTTPVAVKAGTQYWVALQTNKSDASAWAGWNMNDTEEINPLPCAFNTGTGWAATGCLPGPAFAVY